MAFVRIGNSLVDVATIHSVLTYKSSYKVLFKDRPEPYEVPNDYATDWGIFVDSFPPPPSASFPASVQGQPAPPAVKADEGE